MTKVAKKLYNPKQLLLGLGPDGWIVLGHVDPYVFIHPKLLFRKILKPRAAHDFGFYYKCVVVVSPWGNARTGARLGARAWRIQDYVVTETYAAGEAVRKENEDGQVFYEVSTLFEFDHTGED